MLFFAGLMLVCTVRILAVDKNVTKSKKLKENKVVPVHDYQLLYFLLL